MVSSFRSILSYLTNDSSVINLTAGPISAAVRPACLGVGNARIEAQAALPFPLLRLLYLSPAHAAPGLPRPGFIPTILIH